ncbi:MAG: hypothetical protein NTV79_05125, partial [Candidatus Aureabacteria bacterium]|nr:hypothetical protein [Candidatus Auribacterota bacterium]
MIKPTAGRHQAGKQVKTGDELRGENPFRDLPRGRPGLQPEIGRGSGEKKRGQGDRGEEPAGRTGAGSGEMGGEERENGHGRVILGRRRQPAEKAAEEVVPKAAAREHGPRPEDGGDGEKRRRDIEHGEAGVAAVKKGKTEKEGGEQSRRSGEHPLSQAVEGEDG